VACSGNRSPQEFFKGARLALTVDQLNISVAEVRPGGQDALPGSEFKSAGADDPEARPLPSVLIPFSGLTRDKRDLAVPTRSQYVLRAKETSGWQRSASLSFELLQLGNVPDTSSGSVIIMDPEPFLIAQVDYQPLRAANPEISSALAYRTANALDGASWQIQDIDRLITVTLPPQALGEAMEKTVDSTTAQRASRAVISARRSHGFPPRRRDHRAIQIRASSHLAPGFIVGRASPSTGRFQVRRTLRK